MKRILIPFIAFSIWSSIGFAQEPILKDTLLKKLIQSAVLHFPKIKEMEEQLRTAEVREQLIRSNYLPTATADANYRFQAPVPQIPFGANSIRFQPYHSVAGGITINQLIADFGNAIAYQVTQVYYSTVFTARAIEVQQAQVRSLKTNEQLVEAKLKNGDAIEYDVLNTRVRTTASENRLKELQGTQQNNLLALSWLTGIDSKSIKISPSWEMSPALVQQPGNWQQTHPEARLILRQLELQALEKRNIEVSGRPSVFAMANGGFRNGFPVNVDQVRASGYAGLGVSLPILSVSRPKLQHKLADLNMEVSRKSLETISAAIEKDLATVRQNFETHQENLKRSKSTVDAASKAYALAQVRYKEGLITNTELLWVQTQLEEVQLGSLQFAFQLLLDMIESHKIVGSRLY